MLRRVSASAIAVATTGSAIRHRGHKTFNDYSSQSAAPDISQEFENAKLHNKIHAQKAGAHGYDAVKKRKEEALHGHTHGHGAKDDHGHGKH
jgi:hypothetical protein